MSRISKVEPRPPGAGRSAAALRRVDGELRAFHAALVALPIPDRLRSLVSGPARPAPGPPRDAFLGREER